MFPRILTLAGHVVASQALDAIASNGVRRSCGPEVHPNCHQNTCEIPDRRSRKGNQKVEMRSRVKLIMGRCVEES